MRKLRFISFIWLVWELHSLQDITDLYTFEFTAEMFSVKNYNTDRMYRC